MVMSSIFVRITWREWNRICVGAGKDPANFLKQLQSDYGAKVFFNNADVLIEFPDELSMTQFVLTYL